MLILIGSITRTLINAYWREQKEQKQLRTVFDICNDSNNLGRKMYLSINFVTAIKFPPEVPSSEQTFAVCSWCKAEPVKGSTETTGLWPDSRTALGRLSEHRSPLRSPERRGPEGGHASCQCKPAGTQTPEEKAPDRNKSDISTCRYIDTILKQNSGL